MATPTAGEINGTLTNCVKLTSDAIADAPTWVTTIDSAEQAAEGDFQAGSTVGGLASQRAALSGAINPGFLRAHWRAWALERFRLANYPLISPDDPVGWFRLHRILHEANETFNDRETTVPATGSAGGSNVGDGTLSVLAVDWEGYKLQLPTTETKTWECMVDQGLGALKHNTIWRVRGQDASKDLLDETGSGGIWDDIPAMFSGFVGRGGGLQNPSWDTAHSGSTATKVDGWTIAGTPGDVTEETTNVWRTEPGVATSRSLEIAAGSDTISQALSVQRIRAISEWTPWQLQLAYKKTAGGDTGTITLHCGSKSQAFDISTPADTNWNIIRLDMDKDLYYRNWFEDAPDIKVQWASTSDVVWFDGLMFAPMTYIDGLWWWLTGGGTDFLKRDVFTHAVTGGTWANAEAMNSLRWAAREGGAFGAGLPIVNMPVADSGAETIADP